MQRKILPSIAAAAAAMLLTAQAQGPRQDAQAAALLAKHRAYVGWQFGDGTFRTMRITGYITDESGEKTVNFTQLWEGALYRQTYELPKRPGISEQSGFTGNLFWRTDINGFTTPVYGDEAKYLASITALQQEGTTELPATYVVNKTIDGKLAGIVRVTMDRGDAIDLAVDPETGAYVQATVDPGGAYEATFHILSYADVLPGKKMIATFRIDANKHVHTHATFEPNVAVSDADLHPPPPIASWSFENHDPYPITLTPSRILIDATVNGVKGRFILDTGASSIFLDDRFADQAKAQALSGSGTTHTLYGNVKNRVRRVETIAFGGATLHNVLVYTQNFSGSDYRGLDRKGYAGLVGFDLFAGAIVKLDIYASKMTILDPSADLSGVHGLPLIVDLSEGIPAVPMTLNKTIPVNVYLDTGNPGIIFFGPDLVHKRNIKMFSGCANIESLTIGPITYAGEQACEWNFAANNMLVGYDFLRHFDYVFDYPHGRIILTPNKN